jgi:hypothetical protein
VVVAVTVETGVEIEVVSAGWSSRVFYHPQKLLNNTDTARIHLLPVK